MQAVADLAVQGKLKVIVATCFGLADVAAHEFLAPRPVGKVVLISYDRGLSRVR